MLEKRVQNWSLLYYEKSVNYRNYRSGWILFGRVFVRKGI